MDIQINRFVLRVSNSKVFSSDHKVIGIYKFEFDESNQVLSISKLYLYSVYLTNFIVVSDILALI